MNIYNDIDTKATTKNVDYFLKKQLPRLMRRCGHSITELSSPKLSLTPVSTSSRADLQESIIIDAIEIDHVIDAIHKTIFSCSDISKTILIDNYIRNYSVDRTLMDIPYEQAYYYRKLKPKALNEFADKYDFQQLNCKVSKENLIDLHIYKEKTRPLVNFT